MDRAKGRLTLTVIMIVAIATLGGSTTAQDLPAEIKGQDVVIEEVKPELETMGLIWIQEGNVKRLAYVVQTGDTLWDIAARYLNSPYYWPKIWERNGFIINPHLIFPGDILYIYPEGLVVRTYVETGSTVFEIEGLSQPGEKDDGIVLQTVSSTGFITIEELESAGKIVDNQDSKTLLGEGDKVFVDVGKVDRVEPGDRYSIFRIVHDPRTGGYSKVKHPVTGELIGYLVLNIGELDIAKVEPNVSEAIIQNSYREAKNGDHIMPYLQPPTSRIDRVETETESMKGFIIASKNGVRLLAQDDIVYLDKGASDGVVRGNDFIIYKPCELVISEDSEERIRIPEKVLGQIVIIETREKTSVGYVYKAQSELMVGEKVFMSKYDYWEIEGVSQPAEVETCRRDPKCRLVSEGEYAAGMDNPFCESADELRVKPRWQIREDD